MDFEKAEKFLREHWPAALIVAVLVSPCVWTVAHLHFSERITQLDLRVRSLQEEVRTLNERVAALDEAAARRLLRSGEELRPSDVLFSPSPPLGIAK